MFFRALLVALVGVTCNAASAAAFEALEADRPFATSTSRALEQGIYQLEQGTRYEAGAIGTLSFPSLHRLGLGSDAELMIETPIVTLSGGQAKLADLTIGGKWRFAEGGGWGEFPSMGLVVLAAIGEEGQMAPRLLMAIDTALPGAIKLGTNLGAFLALDSTPWLHYTATMAWCPFERLKLGAELLGDSPTTGGSPRMGVGGGLGWLVDPSTQVDMLLYKGIAPQDSEWSASLGMTMRWGI